MDADHPDNGVLIPRRLTFDEENGNCVATDMQDEGVAWMRADKRPGSRKQGWEQFRKRLKVAHGHPREDPGLFVFEGRCDQFKRTVPVLPRCEKDMDDVDTEAENHIADEARYVIRGPVEGGRRMVVAALERLP